MRRREFVTLLSGVATWPLAVRAQPLGAPVIGFLHTRSRESFMANLVGFPEALKEAGYIEGQNVGIEYRFADGQYDKLPALAAELVHRPVAVLVAGGGEPSALAAKAATSTIPIVFAIGSDPVKAGLVASFNRPGGNTTGMDILTDSLEAKRLGLLHQLVPNATTVGFLWNPLFASAESQQRDVQDAARDLGLKIQGFAASTQKEIDSALKAASEQKILALIVGADPFLDTRRDQIIGLAATYKVPTIYQFREHVRAGGLMNYGIDIVDVYRQVGRYAARILKGEKPGDLPILRPTKFEFVINLKATKALSLNVPSGLMAIADEVIE